MLDDLRRALRAHPVHALPDREERVRVAERWLRAVREADALQRKMAERTGSLTRQFDATCDVLEELGYLVPEVAPLVPADTEVVGADRRPPGGHRRRTAARADLVGGRPARRRVPAGGRLARAERRPSWPRPPPRLVFEARRDNPALPAVPAGKVAAAIGEMRRIRLRLHDVEADHGVPVTRDLDLGFAWAAYRWADGQSLDRVLAGAEQAGTELSGGDFVRWARQLIDLLDQLAKVAGGRRAPSAVARAAVGGCAGASSRSPSAADQRFAAPTGRPAWGTMPAARRPASRAHDRTGERRMTDPPQDSDEPGPPDGRAGAYGPTGRPAAARLRRPARQPAVRPPARRAGPPLRASRPTASPGLRASPVRPARPVRRSPATVRRHRPVRAAGVRPPPGRRRSRGSA